MDLQKLTRKIPQLQHVDFSQLDFQELDGWSNHNYLFSLNSKKFVLRHPVAAEEEGINRKAELYNAHQAANAGICYPFAYFDEKSGICLREFIDGRAPIDDEGHILESSLADIAHVLKKLHTLPHRFLNEVDNFVLINNTIEHIKRYLSDEEDSASEYDDLIVEANKVNNCISKHRIPLAPCHNDPNPRNFLAVKTKILLLDWEYSGNGDPAWDLAYFIAHSDLDEASEKLFLDHYFSSQMSKEQYFRIILYKPITLLVFSLWIRLQRIKGHLPVSIEELIYWEQTLNQEIKTYFLSDQHNLAIQTWSS